MAQTAAIVIRGPRTPASAMIGFGLIWAFLILFVLYPLTRIFYDAFSNEAGQLTLANFHEFFTDGYYLRSLWNSLVLGIATVVTTSVIGIAVAFLVFIWTFADFVTPLVVGVQDLLAVQAYLNITQFVDRRIFRMGIVISALLVVLAIAFVLMARHYVALKDYSSLAYSRVERRQLGPVARWLAVGFLALLMFASLLPQAGVVLAAVGKGWSLTALPVHYTLDHFRQVSLETPRFIVNSLLYSGLAVLICLATGVPMAWIMARTRTPGRGAMD